MAGAAALLVVIGLVVFLVIRRGKAKQQRLFGQMVEPRADGDRRYPLSGTAVRIGRNRSCEIALQDDTVSDMHAVIRLARDGSVVIVDLNSLNGTQVNGVKQQQATLTGGEIVEVGATKFRFERGG